MAKSGKPKRIEIIPAIHGKLTRDHKISEPDVYWILEKWLECHPEIKKRQKDIRITRGSWTTEDGLKTEVTSVSIFAGGNANSHEAKNLPIFLAGGGYKHGQYVDLRKVHDQPLCNLFVRLLQDFGIEMDSFGQSNGRLTWT